MIKIEFIRTEIHYSVGNYKESEDIVVRPEQTFKDLDAAWSYAMQHGCNPFKNIRVYSV